MQFVFPAFLIALGALAIPILIHLFYFRRFKKVYFTNVRFLKEVKEETSNRRRLRNLLVLLMRCLAIALLVLAFAQPFLPRSGAVKTGEKSVSVYIDNSFSMGALSKDAALLELAKQRARDIVKAYSISDRFQVLTNDFEGRDQRLVSQEDALSRIEEIRISPATRLLSKTLLRQQQCLNTGKAENKTAFVISDFQTNVADLTNFKDTLIDVQLVPMRAVQENNIAIDSAWFDSPVQILNQPANLYVKITNRGEENTEEVRLQLRHEGQTKPVGSLSIPARSSKVDTVSFNILKPGWHETKLSITDFPVQFDDDYFLAYHVAAQVRVLSINGSGPNRYLNNVFVGADYFILEQADVRSLNYSKFADYQLIVLNELSLVSSGLAQELKTFVQNGGNVLVFPAAQADGASYSAFMEGFGAGRLGTLDRTPRQAAQLNTEAYIFRDVFLNKSANLRLPTSQANFKLDPGRGEYLITYRDGTPMLVRYGLGEGAFYVNAAPLNEKESDLVQNGEIFVPMLFKMAIAGTKGQQIAYTIGKDEVLEARHTPAASGEMVYKLRLSPENPGNSEANNAEFIPEQRILGNKVLLTPGAQINQAGWYKLQLRTDSTTNEYAFNFDRKESDLRYLNDEALGKNITPSMKIIAENAEANFTRVVDEQNQGIVLWRWCVIFALLFLALEVLFLRLWKV
jgi:Aerotolerance regulator N-terminal